MILIFSVLLRSESTSTIDLSVLLGNTTIAPRGVSLSLATLSHTKAGLKRWNQEGEGTSSRMSSGKYTFSFHRSLPVLVLTLSFPLLNCKTKFGAALPGEIWVMESYT